MDPAAPASATQKLLETGILGVVVLGLVFAVIALYRRLNEMQKEKEELRKEKDATIAALQESRLQGMERCTVALTSATAALENQAETNQDLMNHLRTIAQEYQNRTRGRP